MENARPGLTTFLIAPRHDCRESGHDTERRGPPRDTDFQLTPFNSLVSKREAVPREGRGGERLIDSGDVKETLNRLSFIQPLRANVDVADINGAFAHHFAEVGTRFYERVPRMSAVSAKFISKVQPSKASNFNFNPFPPTPAGARPSPPSAAAASFGRVRFRCNYAMRGKNTSAENVSGTAGITFQGCCVRSKGSACSREPLTRVPPPPRSSTVAPLCAAVRLFRRCPR